MKFNFLFSILSLFFVLPLYSQLGNGSFEQNNGLPNTIGQYDLVKNWDNCNSATSSPDYYHVYGVNGGDLPATPAAIVSPCNGSAIMGLSLYNDDDTNVREYISTQFTSVLEVGEKYSIALRLTNGAIPTSSNAGFAIDKIGILFTTDVVNQLGTNPILETPQFEIDSVFYSREWKTIKFEITPTEPFEYMTIGVFHNDDQLEIEQKESNAKIGYYFVDNVVLRKSSDPLIVHTDPIKPISEVVTDTDSNGESPYYIPNSFTPNNDGENDTFTPVINTQEDFVFEVYSRWGELLFKTTTKNIGWDGKFQGNPVPQEVYVWTLRYSIYEGEKLVDKQFHGQINLMR